MPKEIYQSSALEYTHKAKRHLIPVYVCTFLLGFHGFMLSFINSSFLNQFISEASVGMIYTTGSALSIILFLIISRVLHQVGNFKLTIALLLVDFLAVVGMSSADTLRTAIPLFLIHLISVPLLYFNLDVFLESEIGENESGTGSSRGLLLALGSIVSATSPLITASLIDEQTGDFTNAYLMAAGFLIPITAILTFYFRRFADPVYKEIDIFLAIRHFWKNINLRYVYLAGFTLQFFFMLTVVYTPLYMIDTIGLTWKELGLILFWGQTAYIILEYPIGIIADKYIGEKEMMAFGFLVLALSVSTISFITSTDILIWSIVMFVTRVGASFIHVTTESYFFKKTTGTDSQIISFFRTTRPMAFLFGSIVGSLSLLYLPFNLLFIVAALLMVPSIFFAVHLVDTK